MAPRALGPSPACLAGLAQNEEESFEAQARGFTHGHRKAYGVPEALGPEMPRQFQTFSGEKPEFSDENTAEKPSIEKLFSAPIQLARQFQWGIEVGVRNC